MKELTEKQKRFAEEYLLDFNGARAAREAGYNKNVADRIAYQNLRKLEIQKYICELQEKKKEKFELSEEKIIDELSAIAFSRITDYASIHKGFSMSGNIVTVLDFKNTEGLNERQIAAIGELSQTDKGNIKMKLADKLKALELLGKQIGMFKDNVKVDGDVKLSDEDKALLERVNKRFEEAKRDAK